MRAINGGKQRYLYTIKRCRDCKMEHVYVDNTTNPHLNKKSFTCDNCGLINPVYGMNYKKPKVRK